MVVYKTLFEIILYFTEGLIVFYYARSLFEQKYNNILSLCGVFSGYLILYSVYLLDSALLNVIAILLIDTLIFTFLYKCNLKTAFFHSILLVVIMVACEWILIFIISYILKQDFNAYQDNYNIHFLNIISSKLVYYILCIILITLFSKNKKQNKNKSIFWVLLIMPLASMSVLLAFRYITFETELSNEMNIISSVVFVFLLISNIIVFFIYEYSIKNSEKLLELQSENQKKEIDKQYFDVLERNNKDLKIFTHDIKNHLEQISNLTNDERISEYISKLYKTVNRYSSIAISGNKTLDVIISKYNTICSNKNISVTFNVKTANLMDIDNADLSTILNNALDNAVESAEQSSAKRISVDIYAKELFEIIKIQNSCDSVPITLHKKLLTSKKEKELHGFGVESIMRTIKHYDGMFDWNYNEKDKFFEVTIAIPKSE
ncbi:MAG: GHKL domain-containing protein [Clostridium sp.]|nr:GHKL domain-containing protein [Clostridium sp.]